MRTVTLIAVFQGYEIGFHRYSRTFTGEVFKYLRRKRETPFSKLERGPRKMRTPVLPCFAQIDILQDCEALPLQGSCGLYGTG